MGEHLQRLLVTGARIAHRMREAPHRLDVLREHFEAAVDDGFDVCKHALEIRRQRFDCGCGIQLLDLAYARSEVTRAAVGKIVAIDRGQHDVLQAHQLHGPGAVRGLVGIEPATRIAGVDGAEAASTRAHRAHQHQRRGARIPALADVRTLGLFAHGGKTVLAHGGAHSVERLARRHGRAQPLRLATDRQGARSGRGLDAVLDRREALRGAVLVAAARLRLRCGYDRNAFEIAHREAF